MSSSSPISRVVLASPKTSDEKGPHLACSIGEFGQKRDDAALHPASPVRSPGLLSSLVLRSRLRRSPAALSNMLDAT